MLILCRKRCHSVHPPALVSNRSRRPIARTMRLLAQRRLCLLAQTRMDNQAPAWAEHGPGEGGRTVTLHLFIFHRLQIKHSPVCVALAGEMDILQIHDRHPTMDTICNRVQHGDGFLALRPSVTATSLSPTSPTTSSSLLIIGAISPASRVAVTLYSLRRA